MRGTSTSFAALGVVGMIAFAPLQADELTITSFSGNGELTWNHSTNRLIEYRVEWACQAGGLWTNFEAAASMLDHIPQTGVTMRVAVPMVYRVVAKYPSVDGMLLIPSGSNSGTDPDFGAYSLTVNAFYMDRTEVTKAKWDEVYAWAMTNGYSFDNAGAGKAADHPVQMVSWYDCVKWCNARSQREGLTPAYYTSAAKSTVYKTGRTNIEDNCVNWTHGYRLPTVTEWRYAARGGAEGRRFSWSDSDYIQHSRANYKSSSGYSYDTSPTRGYHPNYNDGIQPYTSPAGSFDPNGYGLYDMVGNVWEWCWDWVEGARGTARVPHGAGWSNVALECRVGHPGANVPSEVLDNLGLRSVLPL